MPFYPPHWQKIQVSLIKCHIGSRVPVQVMVHHEDSDLCEEWRTHAHGRTYAAGQSKDELIVFAKYIHPHNTSQVRAPGVMTEGTWPGQDDRTGTAPSTHRQGSPFRPACHAAEVCSDDAQGELCRRRWRAVNTKTGAGPATFRHDNCSLAVRRSTCWWRSSIHRMVFLPAIAVLLWLEIFADSSDALSTNTSSTKISSLAPTAGHAVGGYLIAVYGQGFATDSSRTYTCDFSCNTNSGVSPQKSHNLFVLGRHFSSISMSTFLRRLVYSPFAEHVQAHGKRRNTAKKHLFLKNRRINILIRLLKKNEYFSGHLCCFP